METLGSSRSYFPENRGGGGGSEVTASFLRVPGEDGKMGRSMIRIESRRRKGEGYSGGNRSQQKKGGIKRKNAFGPLRKIDLGRASSKEKEKKWGPAKKKKKEGRQILPY